MTNTCNKCGLKNWHIGNVGKLPIHNGVCQICEDSKKIFKIQDQKNRKLLDDYFQNLRNEYKYDCIVLFTGGRDSSYSLLKLKELYDLNILALTWDNGFFSVQQKKQMENLVNYLDIDHLYINTDWNIVKEIYRNRLFHLGRFCNCVPLAFMFAAPIISKNIAPAIVFSTSISQTINVIIREMGENRSEDEYNSQLLKRGISNIGNIAAEMYEILCVDLLVGEYSDVAIEEIKKAFLSLKQLRNNTNINLITPSVFLPWNEKEIISSLRSAGWKDRKANESYLHSSCLAEGVKSYLSYMQKQINMDVLEIANLYRNNIISFREMNKLLQKSNYCEERPLFWNEFLKKLNITETEIEKIIFEQKGICPQISVNKRMAAILEIDEKDYIDTYVKSIVASRILI